MQRGEFVSIVGPSGCGKSTLFNVISGLEQPTAGRVMIDGPARVEPGLIRLSRAAGASRVREFLYIRLPATLSPLFSGLKIGATYAVTGAVIGEWTGTLTRGLGTHLLKVNASFKTDVVYGVTFLLTAIGVASFLLVMAIEAISTPRTRRDVARHSSRTMYDAPRTDALQPGSPDPAAATGPRSHPRRVRVVHRLGDGRPGRAAYPARVAVE